MTPQGHIRLGTIIKTFGFKGEVVATTDVGELSFFDTVEALLVGTETRYSPRFIETWKARPDGTLILKFEGVDNPQDAAKIINNHLFVDSSLLTEPAGESFYYAEIIGYTAIDENQGLLGTIRDVTEGPMQDLLIIVRDNSEILVPLVEDFLAGIDKKRREIYLNLPDGLVELNERP